MVGIVQDRVDQQRLLMPVRRTKDGRWRYRATVLFPAGNSERISGCAPKHLNNKIAAQQAERDHVERLLHPDRGPQPEKECPTLQEFAPAFLDTSRVKNKASTLRSKEQLLETHIVPRLGAHRLDAIGYAEIEDLKVDLSRTPQGNARRSGKPGGRVRPLSQKTINNVLTVLRRLLAVARKRGIIASVPEVEWLRPPAPEFDFLTFEEADRLLAALDGEERTMALVALRTGLRFGELLGLRWQDADLVAGRLRVAQAFVRKAIVSTKSGKPREVPLGDEVKAALKAHRHLRGPLVFCEMDGTGRDTYRARWSLKRACRRAGLREIGWHALRHTFASHLAMRGAPLKSIQEMLGHATIQMTMRYAHLSPDVSRDAVRLLDGGSRGECSGKELAKSS